MFLGETRVYDEEWVSYPWRDSAFGKALITMADGDTVLLCPGTYEGAFDLICEASDSSRVIQGSGRGETILTGNPSVNWNAMLIVNCSTTLRDLTVRNGVRDDAYDCADYNACGGASGGGIYATSYPSVASLLFERVELTGNEAQLGGGFYAGGFDVVMLDSEVKANRAGLGGGIALQRSTLRVEETTFKDNSPDDVALFDDNEQVILSFTGSEAFECDEHDCG